MHTIAILDENGILTGYAQVEQPSVADCVVPDDCDLEPGKYRWNGNTFVPIATARKADPTLAAIATALAALRDGTPIPPAVNEWINTHGVTDGPT